MQRKHILFGILGVVLAAGIVVFAQQSHGNAPKSAPPKPNTAKPAAAKPGAVKPQTPVPHAVGAAPAQVKTNTPTPPAATTSGNNPQAKPPVKPETTAAKTATKAPVPPTTTAKNDKSSPAKVTKADGKATKSDKPADTKVAKAEPKSDKPSKTTTATTAKTGTTTPSTLTPVQEKLKQNTNLAAKLQDRLPKGTDLIDAAAGFRNLGQFVAAVNVANNLNISFAELKTKMVTNNMSLGQAIQAVRPLTASPTVEAQRAE